MSLPPNGVASCLCAEIRRWGSHKDSQIYWNQISRHAQQLRNNKRRTRFTSVDALRDSEQNGCQTCTLVLRAIEHHEPNVEQIGEVQLELASQVPQLKVTLSQKYDATPQRRIRFNPEDDLERAEGFWLYHLEGK